MLTPTSGHVYKHTQVVSRETRSDTTQGAGDTSDSTQHTTKKRTKKESKQMSRLAKTPLTLHALRDTLK